MPSQGLRRCALALHGLNAPDREWVLSRLPEPQRAEVARLADELAALGFPRELCETLDPQHAAARPMVRERPIDALTLAALLSREPESVGGSFLAARDASASDEILAALPPMKRRGLSTWAASHPTGSAPPAFAAAVKEELLAHLAASPTVMHREAPRWWQTLVRRSTGRVR